MDRAAVAPPVIVFIGSCGKFLGSIAIKVAHNGDAVAKPFRVLEHICGKATGGAADLLYALDCALRVHEKDVHRASVIAAIVILRCAHHEFWQTVSVHVGD